MRISDWSSDVCSSDLWASLDLNSISRRCPCAAQCSRYFSTATSAFAFGLDFDHQAILPLALLSVLLHCNGAPLSRRPLNMQERRHRSEERRVGKECVSTCRSRGSPSH